MGIPFTDVRFFEVQTTTLISQFAAAILGLRVPGVVIEDVATTAKTLPDFTRRWTSFLAGETAATERLVRAGATPRGGRR